MKKYYSEVDTRRIEGSFESTLQQVAFDLIAKMAAEFEEQRTTKDFSRIEANAEATSAGGHVFKVALSFEPNISDAKLTTSTV